MKKFIIAFLCAAMILSVSVSTVSVYAGTDAQISTSEDMPAASVAVGRWKIASKSCAASIPKFAEKIFNKGMKKIVGVNYTPICYLGSQVVAGTNYYYLCKASVVAPGSKKYYCIVSIYKNLKGKYRMNDAKRIKLSKLATDKDVADYKSGAVTVYKKTDKAKLPTAVKKVFNRATKRLVGMNYTPIAYLGSQVVAGANYSILCLGTTVTVRPKTHLYVLTIYDHIGSKKSEITSVHGLY